MQFNKYHKLLTDQAYQGKILLKRILGYPEPFLCIITPIFDEAVTSLKGLIADLQKQSHSNFIHILISNGPSPAIRNLITEIRKTDHRFAYDEMVYDPHYQQSHDFRDLFGNIGARRDYVMQKYHAARYLNLGADFLITDVDFIEKLYLTHCKSNKDIILINSLLNGEVFPKFPLKLTHLDLSNFCYSKSIAKHYHYPHDYDPAYPAANDYRFFEKISNMTSLDGVYGVKDGRASYKGLGELYQESKIQN